MSAHPQGTTRPAEPPSPPSPRGEFKKRQQQAQKALANHPQTPTSPLSMSTPSNRHASPQTSNTTLSQSNRAGPSPSATPMSYSNSQQPTAAVTNTFPTPASIGNDTVLTYSQDDEGQMTRSHSNDGGAHQNLGKRQRDDDESEGENDKRRKTNHDRDETQNVPTSGLGSQDVVMADQGSTGKIWLDGGLGQAWMREPVGSPYLLCRMRKTLVPSN
jgi:hypothetical protein